MLAAIARPSLLALSLTVATTPSEAEELSPCIAAVGTYLTTNTLRSGDQVAIASRSLISLTNGGHAFRNDSDQQAGEGGVAFGESRGAWRCEGETEGRVSLSATLLNFTYPAPGQGEPQIARIDYVGTFDSNDETLRLSAKLFFLPLGADPLAVEPPEDALLLVVQGTKVEVP